MRRHDVHLYRARRIQNERDDSLHNRWRRYDNSHRLVRELEEEKRTSVIRRKAARSQRHRVETRQCYLKFKQTLTRLLI